MKEELVQIPFVAHESSMNRMERANKRLSIIVIIELLVILSMFVSMMVYFYLPTEITTDDISQSISDIDDSNVSQSIGE